MSGNGEVVRNDGTGFIMKRELIEFGDGLTWEERERKSQGQCLHFIFGLSNKMNNCQ